MNSSDKPLSLIQSCPTRWNTLLHCAREVWRLTDSFKFQIQVSHIQGKCNDLADLLSRAHKTETLKATLEARIVKEGGELIEVQPGVFKF